MKCWCFLHHFCLFAFQTVVFATSTVPFLNEVFLLLFKKESTRVLRARPKKELNMLCSICARACVRVCIYFKRAKAKRIIAWRRSFLFVSKRQATETHFFSHEGKTQTSKFQTGIFRQKQKFVQWHRERKVRTHSFVTSTQHACTRRITLSKRNDIAIYGASDSRAWIRSERRLSPLFSFCARTFFACVFDPRRESGNAWVLGTCERIRWDLGR
jgi:hypothetical protein